MRLAIVSDFHGSLVALEAVLADLKTRGPDLVVNLGDCVTSPLWPRETFELLDSLAWPTVRGNHDRWMTAIPRSEKWGTAAFAHDALTEEQRTALASLPPSIEVDRGVLAVHGTPASDMEYLLEESVVGQLCPVTAETLSRRLGQMTSSLALCGHSHNQRMACASGNRVVLNPGSVGCPRYADNPEPSVAEAGSPHARYAIATRRSAQWSVEMIALGYDWSRVVQRAIANGCPAWAEGFLGAR